jgi:hypothetical protein
MKRLIIFVALLTMTLSVAAQHEEGDFTVQPKIGLNVATLSDADKSIADFHFGLEVEYMFTDKFSAGFGAILSNQGAKYNNHEVDLDYVQVPILANYYVLPGLAIKAGIQPGFKTRAKAKLDDGTVDLDQLYGLYNSLTDDKTKVSTVDISIPVGISYEYKNIVLDARYNWGLNKVLNMGDAFYNRWFMISLGYKFNVGL